MKDQQFYDVVAGELQNREIRPGLWARAVAETGSEGAAARALYIRFRVKELAQRERIDRARAESEAKKREEEEKSHRARSEFEAKKREDEEREADIFAKKEADKLRAARFEVERRERDQREAAKPYYPWLIVMYMIGFVILFIWFYQMASK